MNYPTLLREGGVSEDPPQGDAFDASSGKLAILVPRGLSGRGSPSTSDDAHPERRRNVRSTGVSSFPNDRAITAICVPIGDVSIF